MAERKDDLIVRISADSKRFDEVFKKLSNETKSIQDKLETTAKVSSAAFVGLSAVVGGVTARFNEFDKTFSAVSTLIDSSSFKTMSLADGMDHLKNGILQLRASSGDSFENLNKGLFDLISAGVKAEDAIVTLKDATDLAIAGVTDTATAVKAITASTSAFGAAAGSSRDIIEKFFLAQKRGITDVGQLATEFNKVAGLAKNLKISFDETLAASTALTNNGAKPTNQAFSEMKALMTAVINVQPKLRDQSVEVQQALSLENIQRVGLARALEQTKAALGGNIAETQKLLGSSEALSAFLSLTGEQAGVYTDILKDMSDETARSVTFTDALNKRQETMDQAMKRALGGIDAVAVKLGEAFAPSVSAAANAVEEVARFLSSMDKETLKTVGSIGKFALSLTGSVAALSTAGLAYIKIKDVIGALTVAFKGARLAAVSLTGVMTLGLSVALGFLPEIVSWMGKFNRSLEETADKSMTVNQLTKMRQKFLVELKEEEEALARRRAVLGVNAQQIGKSKISLLNEEIAKIDELIKAKEREAGSGSPGGAGSPGKIDAILADHQMIQDLTKSHNEQMAALEKENRQMDFQAWLDDTTQYSAQKKELENQIIQERLQAKRNEATIEQQIRLDNLKKENAERVQRLKDEKQFGTAYAAMKSVFRSAEFEATQTALGNLSSLMQSNNKTAFRLGQAAAIASAVVNVARGVTESLKFGPPLGFILAASYAAAGAVQISKIRSQKFTGAAKGALVQGGTPGVDSVPIMAQDGELISPKENFEEVISGVRAVRSGVLEPSNMRELIRDGMVEALKAVGLETVMRFRGDFVTDRMVEVIEQRIIARGNLNIGTGVF